MTELTRITDATCTRCHHLITDHSAEGEHPDFPGKMVCEANGCECLDFHRCLDSRCQICWADRR